MRRLLTALLGLGVVLSAAPALARDTEYKLSIQDVLQNPEFQSKLGNDITFRFGDGPIPPRQVQIGEYVSNRKTNSFGKPDEVACRWAMLSALIEFRERAERSGGNAVVNLVSYYKKETFSSKTQYECHAGAFVAGVALKGIVVKGQ